ncbi:DUF3108 domain-containing protein [Sunxiuqinia sp. A32]|uniref:DUF3108 domain-containing protein n=1 Tax=Sunxiuqinia sp. A32 TaxID=3461496 RepID=UPI004046127A
MKQIIFIFLLFTTFQSNAQIVEELEYNIRFGFIRGGEAILKANDTIFQDKQSIHYYMEAKTVGLTEKLFPVYDIYESFVNPENYLPYMAIRNVKEQSYKSYNETYFFHENDSIYSQKSGGRKVREGLVDILSVFFYMRQNNLLDKLDKGEEFEVPVYHAGDDFMMTVKYLGTDKVYTDIGEINCHVVSPRVKKGKVLKRSDGLKLYISKDSNKVPLLLEFDLRVGSLKCELRSLKRDGMQLIFR